MRDLVGLGVAWTAAATDIPWVLLFGGGERANRRRGLQQYHWDPLLPRSLAAVGVKMGGLALVV